MRSLLKFLLSVVVLAIGIAAGAWFWAGRQAGPTVNIRGPEKFVGQAGSLDVMVEAPGGQFSQVTASIQQGDKTFPVFTLDPASQPSPSPDNANRL